MRNFQRLISSIDEFFYSPVVLCSFIKFSWIRFLRAFHSCYIDFWLALFVLCLLLLPASLLGTYRVVAMIHASFNRLRKRRSYNQIALFLCVLLGHCMRKSSRARSNNWKWKKLARRTGRFVDHEMGSCDWVCVCVHTLLWNAFQSIWLWRMKKRRN